MKQGAIFLDRKVKLQPGQAVVAVFRMRNLNSLSDAKQVCLVPNPYSQSSVILCRSFSVTRNGLCASVLLKSSVERILATLCRRKPTMRSDTKLEEI